MIRFVIGLFPRPATVWCWHFHRSLKSSFVFRGEHLAEVSQINYTAAEKTLNIFKRLNYAKSPNKSGFMEPHMTNYMIQHSVDDGYWPTNQMQPCKTLSRGHPDTDKSSHLVCGVIVLLKVRVRQSLFHLNPLVGVKGQHLVQQIQRYGAMVNKVINYLLQTITVFVYISTFCLEQQVKERKHFCGLPSRGHQGTWFRVLYFHRNRGL